MKAFKDFSRDNSLIFSWLLSRFNIGEELSNLVGIHARCRYLDRTCPVVVVVAKVKGQLFNSTLVK